MGIPKTVPRAGRYIRQPGPEPYYCFIPAPLPPSPPLRYSQDLQALSEKAGQALGRLDAASAALAGPELLLYAYVRKEAVLSSQIEGTQSSLSDLLLFEAEETPGVPLDDVREVSNYVAALDHGLRRLREFPLSLRLIREMHAVLLRGGRGADKTPGEFRTSQNWIGGTRPGNAAFVPPPPHEVPAAMGALEDFIHAPGVPTLVRAGLAHAQFESIHPFLDGNGRLGRLLITFILMAGGAIASPLLYLSLYFKKRRADYYGALQAVRSEGKWEEWLAFYLSGVAEVGDQAAGAARRLGELFAASEARILGLGRARFSALKAHELLKRRCIISLPLAARELGVSFPTAAGTMERLASLGLVREITGKRRHRVYAYSTCLDILREGAE